MPYYTSFSSHLTRQNTMNRVDRWRKCELLHQRQGGKVCSDKKNNVKFQILKKD